MALINCPKCNNAVSDKAKACPNCGEAIVKEDVLNEADTNKVLCPDCGTEISDADKTCPKCGCPIDTEDSVENTKDDVTNTKKSPKKDIKSLFKKKSFWISVICVVVFAVAGIIVYNVTKVPPKEKTYDKEFISSFKDGLMARWDIASQQNTTDSESLERCIDAELSKIEKYSNCKFEDSVLQEKAIAYINVLKDSKNALTYYNADLYKYTELWDAALSKRSKIMISLINDYKIEFPSKYDSQVKEFTNRAKAAEENDEIAKKIEELVSSLTLTKTSESYGMANYETVVENITGVNFSSFEVNVKLKDADGVIIDTLCDYINDFKAGEKTKAEFFTDKSFESYEISIKYYVE